MIGAGAVGVELAYVYAAYGAKVALVEWAEQLIPGADAEVASVLYPVAGASVISSNSASTTCAPPCFHGLRARRHTCAA